jgi:hypothetical protein
VVTPPGTDWLMLAISLSKRGTRLRRASLILFVLVGGYFVATLVLAGLSMAPPAWISGVVFVGLGTAALVARVRSGLDFDIPEDPAGNR